MSRALSKDRRELKKYLGKNIEYEGNISFPRNKDHIIITNVRKDGKLVTDHIWIEKNEALKNMRNKTKIVFRATAESYKDSHNNRKYGLKRCHGFRTYQETFKEVQNDANEKRKRNW